MSIRSLIILLGAFLLVLEPALPPASMGHIQEKDMMSSCPVKGLCGMVCCRSTKPSLCGQPQAAGLYASGCLPVRQGLYVSASVAKWAPQSQGFPAAGPSCFNPRLSTVPPLFQAEPISPPPRV
jgi:hypothetical protein